MADVPLRNARRRLAGVHVAGSPQHEAATTAITALVQSGALASLANALVHGLDAGRLVHVALSRVVINEQGQNFGETVDVGVELHALHSHQVQVDEQAKLIHEGIEARHAALRARPLEGEKARQRQADHEKLIAELWVRGHAEPPRSVRRWNVGTQQYEFVDPPRSAKVADPALKALDDAHAMTLIRDRIAELVIAVNTQVEIEGSEDGATLHREDFREAVRAFFDRIWKS